MGAGDGHRAVAMHVVGQHPNEALHIRMAHFLGHLLDAISCTGQHICCEIMLVGLYVTAQASMMIARLVGQHAVEALCLCTVCFLGYPPYAVPCRRQDS